MGNENQEIAYCVKCRAKQPMDDVEPVTMKNGRPAVKGVCEICRTGMYKILAMPSIKSK